MLLIALKVMALQRKKLPVTEVTSSVTDMTFTVTEVT